MLSRGQGGNRPRRPEGQAVSDKRAVMPIPTDVWAAIQEGPNGDERLNDEWKRRELFALRIAQMAYEAGRKELEREVAGLLEDQRKGTQIIARLHAEVSELREALEKAADELNMARYFNAEKNARAALKGKL